MGSIDTPFTATQSYCHFVGHVRTLAYFAVRSRALLRLQRGGMAYAGSHSDGILRVLASAAADADPAVSSAARAGFACAARAARRAAVVVAVEALRAGRARAAAATGRCVADPSSLALLPLLADAVRDAPPGALDDAVRATVRAAALGASAPRRAERRNAAQCDSRNPRRDVSRGVARPCRAYRGGIAPPSLALTWHARAQRS